MAQDISTKKMESSLGLEELTQQKDIIKFGEWNFMSTTSCNFEPSK